MTRVYDLAACARVFAENIPPSENQRAQGMPDARRARSLVCEIKKHTSVVTTVTPDSPGIPCAMVLTACFVLSPVIGLYCHRRPQDHHPAGLMPASRHQDHTTSPSASNAFVFRAKASIASRVQRFVTIAKRPSCGRETSENLPVICPTSQAKFSATDWHDGQISWRGENRVK
jgi:hypothetical protein